MHLTASKAETRGFVQAGTVAFFAHIHSPHTQPGGSAHPKLLGPFSHSTHMAEEAELVVLPTKASVICPRGATLLAPAKAVQALAQQLH